MSGSEARDAKARIHSLPFPSLRPALSVIPNSPHRTAPHRTAPHHVQRSGAERKRRQKGASHSYPNP